MFHSSFFGIIPRAVEILQTARDIVSLGHITPQVRTALRAMTMAAAVLEENEVMDEDYEEVDEEEDDIERAPDGPRGSNNLYGGEVDSKLPCWQLAAFGSMHRYGCYCNKKDQKKVIIIIMFCLMICTRP